MSFLAKKWRYAKSIYPDNSMSGELRDSYLIEFIYRRAHPDIGKDFFQRPDDKTTIKQLQDDLKKIGVWSVKWQMPINLEICKAMRIGSRNQNARYELLGKEIASCQQEKDLGVIITNDLKPTKQCVEVEKRAQRILGYIKRQFKTRKKETILSLYNALVRPHLEYAVQFWSPSLRKDIARLEAVQARATKLIPSIRHIGYQRRLDKLNLFSVEKRRLRGQLIETFKILKVINNMRLQKSVYPK